jgi:group I intron endonuclease
MESYSVYKHTCPNSKVYIGITRCRVADRWKNGLGYEYQVFGRAVRKYGWENITHEVLYENLTEDEAKRLEQELIKEFDSKNPEHGYNRTDGGDGVKGYEYTEEVLDKMRQHANRMWANPETKEKLLKHLQEVSKNNVGRKRSEKSIRATVERLSIKVDQYDRDGNFIQTFDSLMDAARSVGKETNAAIVSCCKSKRKSYCGFIWKYHGDELTADEIEWRNSKEYKSKREIVMCDDDWNEIKRFPGFHDAGRELGLNYKAIFSAVKTGRHCNGYKWRYAI